MQMLAQSSNNEINWPRIGIQPSTMLPMTIGSTPCSQNCLREMRPDGEVNSLIQ